MILVENIYLKCSVFFLIEMIYIFLGKFDRRYNILHFQCDLFAVVIDLTSRIPIDSVMLIYWL